jgi:hypothetical protein
MPNPDLNKKSMPGKKRVLDDHPTAKQSKKPKLSNDSNVNPVDSLSEVDFPRGGGTTFNPLEVKAIRAEAVKEANEELFEVGTCILSELLKSCLGRMLSTKPPKRSDPSLIPLKGKRTGSELNT